MMVKTKQNVSVARDETLREFRLSNDDLYLFNEGTHSRLYNKLGAHLGELNGKQGTMFSVWAPNAERVEVEFYHPSRESAPLSQLQASGIWHGFVPDVGQGTVYKYRVFSRHMGYRAAKADPFGFFHEIAPANASVVWPLDYEWNDQAWMGDRASRNALDAPMSIYEMHLGSWRHQQEGFGSLSYRDLAPQLADYLNELGFTHVEFMPVMEYPYYGSWGYQTTGYFAPTSRFGTPQDFMYLIDYLHQRGIGVILDWVPSHFPTDEHGLGYFDGTHLYEHADRRQGFHPDWKSFIFNYGRSEVRSFLLSSALFWLDKYHADGLRVDAVASMLYLDYSRQAGEWIPNQFGGRENLEAINFMRQLNQEAYAAFPDTQTMAEESTAWPMVSRPAYVGGLGFGLKWDMGWMHDTLSYFSNDPVFRKFRHNQLTFRQIYAFNENFVMPLSHDEVVHGKGSLIGKMPGDPWQKFANLRVLLGYMFAQPGKKLMFMGCEFGQEREWAHDHPLDWELLSNPLHHDLKLWVSDLNRVMRAEPALHELDTEQRGFEWIDCCDAEQSILSFLRKGRQENDYVLAILNLTPVPRANYRLGTPCGGFWRELLNSDATLYGGSGQGNMGGIEAVPVPCFGRSWSVTLTLPPLSILFLKNDSHSPA